jgi:hypothetical protein
VELELGQLGRELHVVVVAHLATHGVREREVRPARQLDQRALDALAQVDEAVEALRLRGPERGQLEVRHLVLVLHEERVDARVVAEDLLPLGSHIHVTW